MFEEYYPSELLANAVKEFSKLPGIGEKTALRLVMHLLKQDEKQVENFAQSIVKVKKETHRCKVCNNISDGETCDICSSYSRNHSIICIVEDIQDLLAVERTRQYNGVYHVLGGLISPLDGIKPSDLSIDKLFERIENEPVEEIIFALDATTEGEATSMYLYKKLQNYNIKISSIARGVGFGDELHYSDEITLGRSILERVPFEK